MKNILRYVLAAVFVYAGTSAWAAPLPLDDAISVCAAKTEEALKTGTRIAVIDCRSNSAALSDYIIQELTARLVNSGKLVVVEREDIRLVNNELKFQLSGEVSEESMQSIGKLLGAEVIITCNVDEAAVLRVKSVAVETSRLLSIATAGIAATGKYLSLSTHMDDKHVVTVRTAAELLQAIGPDRIIRLGPGLYDLTEGYTIRNRYISWVDNFDGPSPVIRSVSNLSFIGEPGAVIVITPAYGWVLSFDTCSGIQISDLVMGHSEPGYCTGGVLRFRNCNEIDIRFAELYGSGTIGISLENTSRFLMENSIIRDCTYGLVTIENSRDISFEKTGFRDTGEYSLVSILRSENIGWNSCSFTGNNGYALFSVDYASRYLYLEYCEFRDNKVRQFITRPSSFTVNFPVFVNNSFDGNSN